MSKTLRANLNLIPEHIQNPAFMQPNLVESPSSSTLLLNLFPLGLTTKRLNLHYFINLVIASGLRWFSLEVFCTSYIFLHSIHSYLSRQYAPLDSKHQDTIRTS